MIPNGLTTITTRITTIDSMLLLLHLHTAFLPRLLVGSPLTWTLLTTTPNPCRYHSMQSLVYTRITLYYC